MTASPTTQTAHVQLPQESTLMDAISTPEFRRGGDFVGQRGFDGGAIRGSAVTPAEPEQAEMPTPEQEAAYDELISMVGDSPERAARALELIAEEQAPACPVHPWCIEKGEHTWHNSETVEVTAECGIGQKHNHGVTSPYLEVRLISEDNPTTGVRGDHPAVMIDDCEVDADGVRREVAKIRAALPKIEALAAQLDGKPPARYVPPTVWEDAEAITTAGASGSIIKAALYTPTDVDGADKPRVLAVYSDHAGIDDELDRAGALDLKAQLLAFLPKLDAMIDALPAEVAVEPPENQKAQPADGAAGAEAQA